MFRQVTLLTAGVIAGAAAVSAFLFGLLISAGMPTLARRAEANPDIASPITETGTSPFTLIAEKVSPAVVNIAAERLVKQEPPGYGWRFEGPFDEFFRDFFRGFPRHEGKRHTLGSGFIISDKGYVVTNYHIIKDASDIVIRLPNKKEFKNSQVKVIGYDNRTDIALLKIDTKEALPFLEFGDSDRVRIGDWAIAFGNPFHLEGTVTVGVISAKGRSNLPLPEGPDLQSFIQTDAAINPGNSGGPLVNIQGEVIGINAAITSPSGGNVGIGFAIPANLANRVIEELKSKGKVTRGYLGVYLQDITDDIRQAMDLPALAGVLVSDILKGTPAEKGGLKAGDVIIEYDGKKPEDVSSFRVMVAETDINRSVTLKIIREGAEKKITVKIGEYPGETAATRDLKDEPIVGLNVVDLDDSRIQTFKITAADGVAVISVAAGSPASNSGIQPGDVIKKIGKDPIRNLNDYEKATAKIAKGKPVIFQVQRGERMMFVALNP